MTELLELDRISVDASELEAAFPDDPSTVSLCAGVRPQVGGWWEGLDLAVGPEERSVACLVLTTRAWQGDRPVASGRASDAAFDAAATAFMYAAASLDAAGTQFVVDAIRALVSPSPLPASTPDPRGLEAVATLAELPIKPIKAAGLHLGWQQLVASNFAVIASSGEPLWRLADPIADCEGAEDPPDGFGGFGTTFALEGCAQTGERIWSIYELTADPKAFALLGDLRSYFVPRMVRGWTDQGGTQPADPDSEASEMLIELIECYVDLAEIGQC